MAITQIPQSPVVLPTTFSVVSVQWLSGTEGTANSVNRGKVVMVQGGPGVADSFRICAKDASDVYYWMPLF